MLIRYQARHVQHMQKALAQMNVQLAKVISDIVDETGQKIVRALDAYYRRLCGRLDKAKAITATAHKLARLIYTMLTKGTEYVDKGQNYFDERYRQHERSCEKYRDQISLFNPKNKDIILR